MMSNKERIKHKRQQAMLHARWMKRHPSPKADWHWTDVRLKCWEKLGWAFVYMKYIHPGWGDGGQKKRVKKLCREAAALHYTTDEITLENFLQLYRAIEDEIENMC